MRLLLNQFVIYFSLLLLACSSMRTKTEADSELAGDLAKGNFEQASQRVEQYRQKNVYQVKDRVLYYLNKGLILHYQEEYAKSNENLERADLVMEELFTRSVSKALLSAMMNDNMLDYSGEVYDEIYVNIFKALNFVGLDDFEGAYVEIKRLNETLEHSPEIFGLPGTSGAVEGVLAGKKGSFGQNHGVQKSPPVGEV